MGSEGPWSTESDNPASKQGYGYGLVWLAGSSYQNPQAWFHETGHNFFLTHSTDTTNPSCPPGTLSDYCDYSCAMGGWGGSGNRCYGLPNAVKMGWQSLQATVSVASLNDYSAQTFSIPSQGSSATAGVAVDLGYTQVGGWIAIDPRYTQGGGGKGSGCGGTRL